jgi:2-desacetyl-2-hydroxyethyl bacteriochlorophyllide A dehydrogenase
MSQKTPAVVFPRPNQVELTMVTAPDPAPNEIAVRTVYSGISVGTERWGLTGRYNHWGDDIARYYPYVPGYQRAGIVEAVGSAVEGFAVGDRVFSRTARIEEQDLEHRGWLGHIGYAVVSPDALWKLGPTADMEEASLWQMPAAGAHGVRLAGVQPGELVVTTGQGLIGQMSAQMSRLRGATVISSDLMDKRVQLSGLHSADIAVNGRRENLRDVIRQIQPDGADVVIDTSGNSGLFDFLLGLIRREGRICLQGYYPDPFHIEFHPTHEQRATVIFPCGRDDPAALVPLFDRHKLRIKPLITHRFPIAQAKEAYDLIINKPDEALGIIFDWTSA